jgi:hypothetical protein
MVFPAGRHVVVTNDDLCTRGSGEEIVVCGRRALGERELAALHQYSKCVAQQRPGQSRAVLAARYQAETYREALKKLAEWSGRCDPPGRLKVSSMLLAGAVAEALLAPRSRESGLRALTAASAGPPPIEASGEAEVMSLCAVRAAPSEVEALFRSPAGSEAEKAALRPLAPQLDACLGRSLKLITTRAALRAQLALAAWRLARLTPS